MHAAVVAATILLFAADPSVPPVATSSTSGGVVRLGDPAFSPELKGAVVFVKKKSGALAQGLVTSASTTELVVDGIAVAAGDVASLITLRPARFPAHVGNVVRVTLNGTGAPYRGRVIDLADDYVTLQFDGKDMKMKWGAIASIEVVIDDPPETVAVATATPAPVATVEPRATPEPTPHVSSGSGDGDRRYGDVRTLEIGGSFDFFSGRVSEESSVSTSSASGYGIDARPFVGYFVTPGFEIFGELIVQSAATNFHDAGDSWETFTELGAGAAYFFRRPSGVAFGPFARLQSYTRGSETQDPTGVSFDSEERGWGGDAGLSLRIPIGPSALLSTTFSLYQTSYTWDYYPGGLGSKGDGARSGFDTSVGVTMWIPQ